MPESVSRTAMTMHENALAITGGDTEEALWLMCEAAAYYWQAKGAGIDREGVGARHQPKPQLPPILTTGGV